MMLLAFCLGAFVGGAFSFVVVFEHYRTRPRRPLPGTATGR